MASSQATKIAPIYFISVDNFLRRELSFIYIFQYT